MGLVHNGLWNCTICMSTDLLVGAHARCPNCGTTRDDGGDVGPEHGHVLSDARWHRFHGEAAHCCGTGWSADARYCGGCGRSLARGEGETLIPADGPARAGLSTAFAGGFRLPTSLIEDLEGVVDRLVASGQILDVEHECGPPALLEDITVDESPLAAADEAPRVLTTEEEPIGLPAAEAMGPGGLVIEFDFRSAAPTRRAWQGQREIRPPPLERIDLSAVLDCC